MENDLRETVAQERCPQCKGSNFKVNHYLKEQHHGRIYLQCADCGRFTARIIVHAYVDPDHYQNFLHQASQSDAESARQMLDHYQDHAKKAVDQSHKVKDMLDKMDPQELHDRHECIQELYQEYHIIEDHS